MSSFNIVYPKLPPTYSNNSKSKDQKSNKSEAFSIYEKNIQKQNERIIRHEEAHKAAAGPQAIGSPQYETKTDPNGRVIITGGHQKIAVPKMINKDSAPAEQIEKTKKAAEYVVKGAEAPASFDSLSDADVAIAAKGREILSSIEAIPVKKAVSEENSKDNQRREPGQKLNLSI